MLIQLCPYLMTNGNEVIQFYKKALNAEILFHQSLGDILENTTTSPRDSDKSFCSISSRIQVLISMILCYFIPFAMQ
ncbi:hypothetical protein EPK97_10495 [Chengkuizengella sediminis]|nr:hypothetical protein [Chengkuizengella sediminis]